MPRYTTVVGKFHGLHTFIECTHWLDGTWIGDSINADKFDDILFKKKTISGKPVYYKRYLESGVFNMLDWGVEAGDNANMNTNFERLQGMINYIPPGYPAQVYIPSGMYYLPAKDLQITDRPYRIFGDSGSAFCGYASRLHFMDGGQVTISGSYQKEGIIERLMISSSGKTNGVHDGLAIRCRIILRDITVKGFSNCGVGIWANISDGNEASKSILFNVHCIENGKDGIHLMGEDANAITVLSCDVRDNGRYGVCDNSFLGNNIIGSMGHNNTAGHYNVKQDNAWSVMIANYGEQDGSKPNPITDRTVVIGGLSPNGWTRYGKTPFHPTIGQNI